MEALTVSSTEGAAIAVKSMKETAKQRSGVSYYCGGHYPCEHICPTKGSVFHKYGKLNHFAAIYRSQLQAFRKIITRSQYRKESHLNTEIQRHKTR